MKTRVNLLFSLALSLFISSWAFAQSCSTINLSKAIQMENSSETEEFKVDVSEDVSSIMIGVSSTIKTGKLKVEIYDPNNKKQGHFSVEGDERLAGNLGRSENVGNVKEMVCGTLHKEIKSPQKGKWLVRLIPDDVTGDVNINTCQVIESE